MLRCGYNLAMEPNPRHEGLFGLAEMAQASGALRVVDLLEAAGHDAWLVGGCVRDALMGRSISDVDMASSAQWREVKRICESAGMAVHETGVAHGTVTVVSQGESFEVTTYRSDSPTSSDSRHPDSVRFVSTIEEDLSRRDFTMNALAWHPQRGILDLHGGQADIEARVIRAVGDPSRRFKEDALRILRACRFSSQLGFSIEPFTYACMMEDKSLMSCVSAERVVRELDLLLMGEHVHDALMSTVDVLAAALPELVAMKGCLQETKYHCYDVLEHTAWSVQLARPVRLVRWTMLCHDMGKPACAFFDAEGVKHFYGHDRLGASIAEGLMQRLAMPKSLAADVVTLVGLHGADIAGTPRAVRRVLMRLEGRVELFRALLDVKRADALAHAPGYQGGAAEADRVEVALDEVLADDVAFKLADLAIDGRDVIALGAHPGPEVGRLLQAALGAVADEIIPNDKAALISYIESKLHV